jgi:ribosomal protein L11 methyltransferase
MTNESYVRLHFLCPSPYQDFAIAELAEFGVDGFDQNDQGFYAYLPQRLYTEALKSSMLTSVSNSDYACDLVQEEVIQPKNWNEEWEKSIRSQYIAPFFICPSWVHEQQPPDCIRLTIDPKMAFGTGNHETTRLILQLLPKYVHPDCSVLDVGTGTGILAIAALKLGAKNALGFDVDEWSYTNAIENAEFNYVSTAFDIKFGSFETVPADKTYDLVIANVNRNILLELSSKIVHATQNGGTILLSGLLGNEDIHILVNNDFRSLELLETSREGDWICVVFRKV